MSEQSDISTYRLYRGAGSAAAIDYSTPIATVTAAQAAGTAAAARATGHSVRVRIPPVAGGWPAGVCWFIAVRSVDVGGVEFADPAAIIRAEFDSAGRLLPARPDAVVDLSVRPATGQRLRIGWRYQGDADLPPAVRFEVFLAAQTVPLEQVLAGSPVVSVPAGRAGIDFAYAWTSAPLAAGGWRAAVRAVASSVAAGPVCSVAGWARASRAVDIQLLTAEVR